MFLNLNDSINFISKLTLRRFWNICLIYFSYSLSKSFKKNILLGLPFAIDIEPTTSCNLRCPECPSGLREFQRPTGMLKEPLFKKIINQTKKHISYLTFYFQGEPYLNPQFHAMVKYAHENKIYSTTSTNGHYLDDKNAKATILAGLDRLIISIDGMNQETYEKYRIGGDLKKVIEGTKNILKWKKELKSKTPHIIIQCLANQYNEDQINDLKQFGKELNVDEVRIKTMQVYEYENGNQFIPTETKLSRYKLDNNGRYKIKNSFPNECWRLWHSTVITWDGRVIPCCFDKDANYQFGLLDESTLSEIWRNHSYTKFRSQVLKDRSKIEICRNCSEGTNVWN